MKNLLYLGISLCFVFFGCKEQKIDKSRTKEVHDIIENRLTFEAKNEKQKHIVLVSGDEEYRSEEALPQLAKILSKHYGFKCTVLFAQDPAESGVVNPNYTKNIPGLEVLDLADLLIVFTRFRALPDEQMMYLDAYLKAGKPVIGIRTATHAFNFQKDTASSFKHYGNYYNGDKAAWTDGFGKLVLGENWVNHHGHHKHQSTRGIFSEEMKSHPITNGILDGEIWGPTDVYGIRLPLQDDSQSVILGQVINREGEYDKNDIFYGMKPTDNELALENNEGLKVNNIYMPIAWIKTYQLPNGEKGRAFTSTIGAATDLLNEGVRRLLINGVFWVIKEKVPEKANVDLVGEYNPSAYGFKSDEYWIERNLKIKDLK